MKPRTATPFALIALLLGVLLTVVASQIPARAGSKPVITVQRIPLNDIVFNPCTGEDVQLRGTIYIRTQVVEDGSGGFHVHEQSRLENVTGVGLTSGLTYTGSGSTMANFNTHGPPPSTFTEVQHFRLRADKLKQTYRLHALFHVTVNARGVVTSEKVKVDTTCN
jgi:hypothetical protein